MTSHMAMGSILIWMEQSILGSGKMINKMDSGKRNGLMEQFIMANIWMVGRKAMENLFGRMDQNMKGSLKKII